VISLAVIVVTNAMNSKWLSCFPDVTRPTSRGTDHLVENPGFRKMEKPRIDLTESNRSHSSRSSRNTWSLCLRIPTNPNGTRESAGVHSEHSLLVM